MPLFPVHRDPATAAFFDGTARGEFLLARDTTTGAWLAPQTDVDSRDELERVPAAGTGSVVSWAVVPGRGERTEPTVVAIVQLDEGPWWWTELVDVDPHGDLADLRVQAQFMPSGPGEHDEQVPVFAPVG
ncbi:Zn-ribbon domain-containing OB-fold protein [Nakamurella leprariae]|uniref:OB-fold domain-containing protein n=1 Tax=Nakamurella leprariae TaxID=2803911 RepID=A0A939C0V7_9ACTN|nr:OB-fold domain-containing protein [Nakamurella leprariae]MBM9466434.1 OB-fold domain-containing protein [Nakamurella leprariae]